MKRLDTRISNKTIKDFLTSKQDGLLVNKDEFGGKVNTSLVFNTKDKKYYNEALTLTGKKGSGCRSVIPDAEINFHTHPVECYLSQSAIWGWPSGGDMTMLLKMKELNKVHIVFSLEGTYLIKTNPLARKVLTPKQKEEIGYEFVKTHKYRSFDNYSKHHTYFKKEFPVLKKTKSNDTLKLWLHLANHQYFIYKKKDHKIFNIMFVPNDTFQDDNKLSKTWDTLKILNKNNISKYVKINKTIIINPDY